MKSSQAAYAVTKPSAEVTVFSYQIVESTIKDRPTPGRAFRGFRFVIVKVSLTYQDRLYEFCFDKITVSNAYPVSMQLEILALLRNATHISTIDAVVFFYQ